MRPSVYLAYLSMAVTILIGNCGQANTLSGEALYDVACGACHSLGTSTDHRIGPPLGALLNRQAGAIQGYRYSEALSNSGWTWTLPTLLAWLSDPDAAMPNNAMNYVNHLTATEAQLLGEWLLQQP